MKTLIVHLFLIVLLCTTTVVSQTTMLAPGGSGTFEAPYLIASLANLSWLAQNSAAWGSFFKQTANINALETQHWDDADDNTDDDLYNDPNDGTSTGDNNGFLPIGNLPKNFTGNYDGDGFSISNLKINRPSTDYTGFWGWISGSAISNLGLTSISVTGAISTGGMAGRADASSSFNTCFTTGSVTGGVNFTGGLLGDIESTSTITDCYSSCTVSGFNRIGGLIGVAGVTVTINKSYASGNVTQNGSTSFAGGFIGEGLNDVKIFNCYSTGNVTGYDNVGGFAGANFDGESYFEATLENCYSVGSVSGTSSVGGLVGESEHVTNNNFWNTTTSGTSNGDGFNDPDPTGITGKTTSEMKTQSTFTNAGWNTSIWYMDAGFNDGYPYLAWQNPGGTPLPVELTSFTASLKNNTIELSWTTGTEVNNYGFQVERKKKNGKSEWEKVGFIQGHGNSNSPKEYVFIDKNLSAGKYLYRLKQIDNDGSFKYSDEIEVEVAAASLQFSLEQNYPNPFNPVTTITYGLQFRSNVKLEIYDILGQIITELINKEQSAGIRNIYWNANKYASGVYIVRLIAEPTINKNDKFISIKKMILMK